MKINYDIVKIILQSKDHTLLRRYAVWLKLKYIYVRGRIYNYSLSKISALLGISRQAVKKYIDFFVNNGWCFQSGKHLCFISHDKFKEYYNIETKFGVNVNKDLSVKEIVSELRYSTLKVKQSQFNYIKNIENNLANPINNSLYKAAKRKAKKLSIKISDEVSNIQQNIKLSYKRLSDLVGASPSTAKRLVEQKVQEGRASVFKGERILLYRNVKTEFNVGWCQYQHKTKVYFQEPNSYAFF
jgi:predicted transcriptional regulator